MPTTPEVREVEGKWGLYLGDDLLGTSKARFDADYAREVLIKWFVAGGVRKSAKLTLDEFDPR